MFYNGFHDVETNPKYQHQLNKQADFMPGKYLKQVIFARFV